MHKVTSGWYLDLSAITLSFIRQDAVVLWRGGAVSVSSPNTGTVTV